MTIKNFPQDETSRILSILENSAFEFHLTGSRFFGSHQINSDYDFFTENAEDCEEYLIENGFRTRRTYKNMVGIAKLYELGKVQVQLVNGAKLKNKIQDALKKIHSNFGELDKRDRTYRWRLAYAIANELNKE